MFFTSAASGDLRPSFFEMYAQDKLVGSLRPAVKFAIEVLAVRQPYLFRLIPYADEIFLAIHAFIEANSLVRSNASVAEAFYSLRRAPAVNGYTDPQTKHRLPRRDVLSSLFFIVFVPYLKARLDGVYEQSRGGSATRLLQSMRARADTEERSGTPPRLYERVRTWLLKLYPTLSSLYDLAHFGYNLLYLFERVKFFSPLLHLQQLVVRRLTMKEMQEAYIGTSGLTSRQNRLWGFLDKALLGLKYGLIIGVFAFKALEYYYRVESKPGDNSRPVFKPPSRLEPATSPDATPPTSSEICPLCRKPRSNPAACTVSGYVFCYRCIFEYIEQRKRCPVTLISANTDNIRRIYQSQ